MKKNNILNNVKNFVIILVIVAAAAVGWDLYRKYNQNKILQQVISRLTDETRTAEVIVSDVNNGLTTIKFVEYDGDLRALSPHYFTFKNNLIQFQSLVVRFEDDFVKYGDKFRGKSAYVFWKVFALGDANTAEIFEINKLGEIPNGYQVGKDNGQDTHAASDFEKQLWRDFWDYALKQDKAKEMGVKNAQVEAPGTKFVPGKLYKIKIEHDGGLRIDVEQLPEILRGETIK